MGDSQKNAPHEDISEEISIEDALKELSGILDIMEGGSRPLEETFALYEKGLKLVNYCRGRIDNVEKRLRILEDNGGQETDEAH